PVAREDVRMDVFLDREVLARRAQVLPDRHDVDGGFLQSPQELQDLAGRLTEADHEPGLGGPVRAQAFGLGQKLERAGEAGAGGGGGRAAGAARGERRGAVATWWSKTPGSPWGPAARALRSPWKSGVRTSIPGAGSSRFKARIDAAKCAAPPSSRSSRLT